MNMANLELCKELFGVSGWEADPDGFVWRLHKPTGESALMFTGKMLADNFQFHNSPEAPRFREENDFYPAYDLGYLLRKLPDCALYKIDSNVLTKKDKYIIHLHPQNNVGPFYADTPEDVACKLAIEQFKKGILTPTKEQGGQL